MTVSSRMLTLVFALLAAFAPLGCGDSSSSTDAGVDAGSDAAADTDSDTDTESDTGNGTFNPDDPGISLTLLLGSAYMMNNPMEFVTGFFMIAAREEFEVDDSELLPIDTCVVKTEETPVPECTDNTDCAPEQECLPETDDSGNPIAGTESCVTPRDPIDLGPFTVEGFTGGAVELAYNAGQSGAYTPDGAGDGTLAVGTMAFDASYTFSGDGGGVEGLGAFDGELYVAPLFELTSPELQPMAMEGLFGIEASMAAELPLEWSGSNPDGDLQITITGGQSDGTSVVCRVADDGAFTIPAEMMASTGLGATAFLNMLTFERRGVGHASGEGLTFDSIQALSTTLVNIIQVE